jgi:hypothetical protein
MGVPPVGSSIVLVLSEAVLVLVLERRIEDEDDDEDEYEPSPCLMPQETSDYVQPRAMCSRTWKPDT